MSKKRGKYKRTAAIREKNAQPSIEHGVVTYVRKCDLKVGKWKRVNDPTDYNETLEKADGKH